MIFRYAGSATSEIQWAWRISSSTLRGMPSGCNSGNPGNPVMSGIKYWPVDGSSRHKPVCPPSCGTIHAGKHASGSYSDCSIPASFAPGYRSRIRYRTDISGFERITDTVHPSHKSDERGRYRRKAVFPEHISHLQ